MCNQMREDETLFHVKPNSRTSGDDLDQSFRFFYIYCLLVCLFVCIHACFDVLVRLEWFHVPSLDWISLNFSGA